MKEVQVNYDNKERNIKPLHFMFIVLINKTPLTTVLSNKCEQLIQY